MCIFSTPEIETVKAPEPEPAPTEEDKAVTAARDAERRRRLASGQRTTLLTGGTLSAPQTARKTLLGQ